MTHEILEKVKNIDNLLLVVFSTRGFHFPAVLEKEIFSNPGLNLITGIVDPTFYRDDQNRIGSRFS